MVITKLIIMIVLLCSESGFLFTSGAAADKQMCKDKEREALLSIKQGLKQLFSYDASTDLSSWGSSKHNMDCCYWEGVSCSNTTGHVISLNLHGLRGEISPSLLELSHLNELHLYYNDFGGNKIPEFIGSLDKLETLRLSDSNFSGDVPSQLGNLTNLRGLHLHTNHLTSKDLTWLSNLTLLSTLDLSGNQFDGPVSWLSNLTQPLSSIDLSYNQFAGQLPDLKAFSSLTELYLQSNNLTGQLPASFGQLSSLEVLNVSHNSFQGTISEVHLSQLCNLTYLDLSFNSLALNFSSRWIPPFQLYWIGLAGCNTRSIPSWLQTQTCFEFLDLSFAGISEEVPTAFWNYSNNVRFLNLSHNSMSGLVPDIPTKFSFTHLAQYSMVTIDISFNNFSGPLPSFDQDSFILDLSHNMFNGTIQSMFRANYLDLRVLDLSYNQLSGELSNCFENMTTLLVLNLAENKFHGRIPSILGSSLNPQTLILRNNNFTGELPSTLSNCDRLILIDCGGNALTGKVPTWIGSLTNLVFLILAHNNFYGNIPPEICRLSQIQVLDLSHNIISGRIPQCFQNVTSLVQTNGSTDVASVRLEYYAHGSYFEGNAFIDNVMVRWKRQESEYRNTLGLLKLIDLSSNNLVGKIPLEISSLAGLASLNLSQNHLTGNIMSEIGQMKMLESLDLSRNNLSGEIPVGLAKLNYLAVLDLSSNNLSGKIPQGTQLHSFDASAYAGNRQLCGQPLPDCSRPPVANRGNQGAIEEQKDEGFNLIQSLIQEYLISSILGYIVGFWVTVGPLLLKRSWRNSYFGYLSMIGDWLYVTLNLSRTRLIRYIMKSNN